MPLYQRLARTQAHRLHQAPVQGSYKQQSRSAQSQLCCCYPWDPSYPAPLFSCLLLVLLLELTLIPVSTSFLQASFQAPYSKAGSQGLLSSWTYSLTLLTSLIPGSDCSPPSPTAPYYSYLLCFIELAQPFPSWTSLSIDPGLPPHR